MNEGVFAKFMADGKMRDSESTCVINCRRPSPIGKRADQHAGAVEGTPLASMPALGPLEMVRHCDRAHAEAGVARPPVRRTHATLRGGGDAVLSRRGADSIFVGEKLVATPNPGHEQDDQLLKSLGMKPLEPHAV